ncbi:MAG TPA: hypothetical protein VK549_05690 [Acidimicrobiia bacterium]|nr:hypothetical protein [Acidimicrobiia bacterium]
MAAPTQRGPRGTGWIIFAGIMMIIAGANMFINGLWALNATNSQIASFKNQLLFSDTNLDTWGWIYVIVGGLVLLAGLFVFMRQRWAVMVGILAATVQAIFAFFWIFSPQWPAALAIIVIDLLVLHGLVAYGDREEIYT